MIIYLVLEIPFIVYGFIAGYSILLQYKLILAFLIIEALTLLILPILSYPKLNNEERVNH